MARLLHRLWALERHISPPDVINRYRTCSICRENPTVFPSVGASKNHRSFLPRVHSSVIAGEILTTVASLPRLEGVEQVWDCHRVAPLPVFRIKGDSGPLAGFQHPRNRDGTLRMASDIHLGKLRAGDSRGLSCREITFHSRTGTGRHCINLKRKIYSPNFEFRNNYQAILRTT